MLASLQKMIASANSARLIKCYASVDGKFAVVCLQITVILLAVGETRTVMRQVQLQASPPKDQNKDAN